MPFSVVWLVANESLRNSCISSTISWSTPISAIVSMSSLRDFKPLEVLFEPLLHPLDALAREPVGAVDALEEVGIGRDLIGDQPALELGRGGDELEGAMGDDDAVPLRGRGSAPETAGACP